MWIFTVNGFFTVIQDRKNPNYVWLRARLREDIERNFPGVTVTEHPGADYLFRAKLPREQVAQRVMELVMENNVTSHFKDVMIRTASKPQFGSRSSMLYGVWNSGAAMQPYAPYSRTPRTQAKTTWKPGDRTVGQSQSSLDPYVYGGTGSGRHASDFDWDNRNWSGGDSAKDPAVPSQDATDEEFETWWAGLTPAERDEYLDAAEAEQRQREALDEDYGAAARALEFSSAPEVTDVLPDPRNRPGSRRQRRKAKRKNRHNQTGDYRRMGFSPGDAAQEAVNRQAYLDKKYGKGKA